MTAVLQSDQNFAVSVARNVRPGEGFQGIDIEFVYEDFRLEVEADTVVYLIGRERVHHRLGTSDCALTTAWVHPDTRAVGVGPAVVGLGVTSSNK